MATPITDAEHRERLARRFGAHLQVSEARIVEVPAAHGINAHKSFLVTTACGKEKQATLCSPNPKHVRCPDCLRAMAGQENSDGR